MKGLGIGLGLTALIAHLFVVVPAMDRLAPWWANSLGVFVGFTFMLGIAMWEAGVMEERVMRLKADLVHLMCGGRIEPGERK